MTSGFQRLTWLSFPSRLAINSEYMVVIGMDAGKKLRHECAENAKAWRARYVMS
jgi:hypothetical protein